MSVLYLVHISFFYRAMHFKTYLSWKKFDFRISINYSPFAIENQPDHMLQTKRYLSNKFCCYHALATWYVFTIVKSFQISFFMMLCLNMHQKYWDSNLLLAKLDYVMIRWVVFGIFNFINSDVLVYKTSYSTKLESSRYS